MDESKTFGGCEKCVKKEIAQVNPFLLDHRFIAAWSFTLRCNEHLCHAVMVGDVRDDSAENSSFAVGGRMMT
jgi:hypothetical protein